MTEGDLTHEIAWLEEVGTETDSTALAAAALQLLNSMRGMDLAPPRPEPKRERGRRERREDDGSRAQRSQRAPRDEAEVSRVNEVELFIGLGKTAGVRPGDIVGALANEFDVNGKDIGRVMLFDRMPSSASKSIAERVRQARQDHHSWEDDLPVHGTRPRWGGKPVKRRTQGTAGQGSKKDHKRRKKGTSRRG